jgi:hypothetical protein
MAPSNELDELEKTLQYNIAAGIGGPSNIREMQIHLENYKDQLGLTEIQRVQPMLKPTFSTGVDEELQLELQNTLGAGPNPKMRYRLVPNSDNSKLLEHQYLLNTGQFKTPALSQAAIMGFVNIIIQNLLKLQGQSINITSTNTSQLGNLGNQWLESQILKQAKSFNAGGIQVAFNGKKLVGQDLNVEEKGPRMPHPWDIPKPKNK